MNLFLDNKNFPSKSVEEDRLLSQSLSKIMEKDYKGSFFTLLSDYRRVLSNNNRRKEWEAAYEKLMVLFKCGKCAPLDGPMIGVTVCLRDSDYFKKTAGIFGKMRSAVANIQWMATCWNITFAGSNIWMGKTFESVSREIYAKKCDNNQLALNAYNSATSRIGRNFFRKPHNPNLLQLLGLPVLVRLWHLINRPMSTNTKGFEGELLETNIEKEKNIPYTRTGGYFLSTFGISVVSELNGKLTYQLDYRYPALKPVYPMTRLIDELVQIDDGIYLGQLIMATKHYSIGTLGELYRPGKEKKLDYGYQNNGFFLMIDPAYAKDAYAENAFSELRPHPGEMGYIDLGYDKKGISSAGNRI